MDLSRAQGALTRGNLQLADMLCRQALASQPDDAQALVLQREVQAAVGPVQQHRGFPHTLLIKAWGYGFWSDLDHVLGSLLLAELTGRTPIVYWGSNSLFRSPDTDNAFEHYFRPVSPFTLDDLHTLLPDDARVYPAKWRRDNLRQEELLKWEGPGSRLSGMYLLHRDEELVVSDYHSKVNDLMRWIPPGSPWHGLNRHQIYRALVRKYLHLQPHMLQKLDALWQQHLASDQWLAVHVRGTDKVLEMNQLDALNQAYHGSIDKILSVNGHLRIFLLTDSQDVLADFQNRWKDRVFYLDCQRGQGIQGVHLEGHPGLTMGEQVLTDCYLAARCDMFLGNGASNVSTGIRHLKDWPAGSYFLLGQDFLGQIDTSLHEW